LTGFTLSGITPRALAKERELDYDPFQQTDG